MAADTAQERLAENVWLRLVSRSSMIMAPVILLVFGYTGERYLNSQDSQITAIIAQQVNQSAVSAALATRVTIIETDRARSIADYATDKQQVLAHLEQLAIGQSEQVAKIAALTATIDGLKDRLQQGARP